MKEVKALVIDDDSQVRDLVSEVLKGDGFEVTQAEQLTLRQEKVLDALRSGARSWDELRQLTKINEEGLGFVIGELLDLRKIWTGQKEDVRIYGIEKRQGLVPRFGHPQRRASDLYA